MTNLKGAFVSLLQVSAAPETLSSQSTSVVVTLSFNAMMDLANFECNLKTRDSQKWPRKGDMSFVGTLSERT